MDIEERIAKWERVTIRFAAFAALVIIVTIAVLYAAIEGAKFLIHRFAG